MAYLKLKEVATFLRVSPQTVSNLIKDRKLQAIQVGGQTRIDSADLEEFLKVNHTAPIADVTKPESGAA